MERLWLNIGLNIGSHEDESQLTNTLNELGKYFTVRNLKIETGTFEGVQERTLAVEILSFDRNHAILSIEKMLKPLNQIAIALKGEDFGILIYSRTHVGTMLNFDEKFFIGF